MAACRYAVRDGRIPDDAGVACDGRGVGGVELPRAGAASDPRWSSMNAGSGMNGVKTAAATKAATVKATGAKPAATAVEASAATMEAADRSAAETAAATAVKTATATAVETAATATMKATTATAAVTSTSATRREDRISKQRSRCRSCENCDERQPHVSAPRSFGHVRSHLCQNI